MANTIPKETFPFLIKLSKNNNRDWFNDNKAEFKAIETKVKEAYNSLGELLNNHDQIDKVKVFRIYRDVRFSKNKLPYNGSNLGSLYYNVMHSKKIIKFNNSKLDNLIKKMITKNHIDRPLIQNVISEFDSIYKPLRPTKLFKKDKKFFKKIQKKYSIPKNWEYFILSFNNVKLPKI